MPDPSKHADKRGWIESILRYVPGFRGYLEKEYRRESDALARTHLSDRLTAAKRGISQFQKALLQAGQLDGLDRLESAVALADTLGNRFRGDVRGYSGFFDFVKVDTEVLDRIYENDLEMMNEVEALVKQTETLSPKSDNPEEVAESLETKLNALGEKYSLRSKILTGLD